MTTTNRTTNTTAAQTTGPDTDPIAAPDGAAQTGAARNGAAQPGAASEGAPPAEGTPAVAVRPEPRMDLMGTKFGGQLGKRFAGIGVALQQGPLPDGLGELVSLRASQINGCAVCVDMHTKEARAAGESELRLHLVAVWREAVVFTAAERAALALTEEGTRLTDGRHGVSDQAWNAVREHFDDEQTAALVSAIAVINAANRFNVIVGNPAGEYRPGMFG